MAKLIRVANRSYSVLWPGFPQEREASMMLSQDSTGCEPRNSGCKVQSEEGGWTWHSTTRM